MITLFVLLMACSGPGEQKGFEVNIRIDATETLGDVHHIWRFFGADEPNYAYMEHGSKLLNDLGSLRPGRVYFRTHNLLNTGDGTPALNCGSTNVYTEDEQGNPVYDWQIMDSIFDAYLENGVRPYVQIGFMPRALSSRPDPYRHHWNPDLPYGEIFTGWAYPPTDYQEWEELVYQWTLHCVDRYGKEEVEKWYWQTWNEPNIPYWQGTREEFFRLHDHAIQGVLRALPSARVGGPDVAGTDEGNYGADFFTDFIDHCIRGVNHASGETGTKLDFVSFHAKGRPEYVEGHVRMGIWHQLTVIDHLFKTIHEYPEIRNLPVVIGESDPEGCAACQGDHLGYRNGTMYASYTAASFVRKLDLALKYDINFHGALTWAFEFENEPYFAGFRALSTNGINKPVFNVFRMFSMMEGRRIAVSSDTEVPLEEIVSRGVREDPDVSAYASMGDGKLTIMAWHYHDDDLPGPPADLSIDLMNLPAEKKEASLDVYLVDSEHSNAYTVWQELGSPQDPDSAQYRQLEESSRLEKVVDQKVLRIRDSRTTIDLALERQGVALLVLSLNN